jgi:predicted phage terminase large subunit-like protein
VERARPAVEFGDTRFTMKERPAPEGPAELEAAKVRLGSYGFAAQYQQSPTAREGNLIKIDWLSATYRALPDRFDSIVLSLDTAYKTGASNDYSAAVVIGTLRAPCDGFPPGHYLLEAWRGKVEFGELKRKLIGLHQTWRSHTVLVEDAASGQSLVQELRIGTHLPIKPIRADRDKLARLTAVTPILEARRLLLPETAWWRDDFIAELTSFPAGAHDDWCDALAMALNYLRDESPARKWITATKLRFASVWVGEGATVDEAAARADLSSAEVQDYLDRAAYVTQQQRSPSERLAEAQANGRCLDIDPVFFKARTHSSSGTPTDPTAWLFEAHAAGRLGGVDVDPWHWQTQLKPRLSRSGHPDAAAIIDALDARFGR